MPPQIWWLTFLYQPDMKSTADLALLDRHLSYLCLSFVSGKGRASRRAICGDEWQRIRGKEPELTP
jgi:hypothetical protein